MSLAELFFIAVGLSMDAFAVAICKGLGMRRLNVRHALVIGLFFGGFQALMPTLGWLLGAQFAAIVTPVDHWIAFILLAFIGAKMVIDALRSDDDDDSGASETDDAGEIPSTENKLDLRELFGLAIATSIDALAVGITFAFLSVDIVPAASFIGTVTFVLSVVGVAIGNQFGARWEKPSSIVGGVVLILIGLKILLEHLGILVL